MGILDSSTNNIILDAVLTDVGRQLLARNDGSFSIVKFALGDDEVQYDIIQRYGRTVGAEKIEKNTPVFEALTSQNLALKYKLVSVSNPNLVRLPALSLSSASNVDSTNNTVTLGRNNQKTATITISQDITNESVIDVELRDQAFTVEMNNIFLQVLRSAASSIDNNQKALYLLQRSPNETSTHGSILEFTLATKSLTDALFQVYGSTSNKNIISTYVRVTGLQSGAVLEFKVNINKTI